MSIYLLYTIKVCNVKYNEDNVLCRKLFIGGIHRSTTQESLKNYFEKFGKVSEVKLMIDKLTGNSRGFGFVTYVDPLSVNEVLLKKPHTLDNKLVIIYEQYFTLYNEYEGSMLCACVCVHASACIYVYTIQDTKLSWKKLALFNDKYHRL